MELHEELRSMKLGNMSISEYFKKIKVASDLLSNIGSPIDNKNLVMCAVNGLGDKYEKQNRGHARDNTSSSTVFMAVGNKNNSSKGPHNKQLCRNFRFGERCKYLHVKQGVNVWNRSGPSTFSQSQFRALNNQSRGAMRPGPTSGSNGQAFGPTGIILGPVPNQPMHSAYGPRGLRPGSSHGHWKYSDQPTALPRAFNATTLRYADNNEDPGWYMDTGVTSHLSLDVCK
ncbi:hypothetical protein Tco_1494428 [Tanacetum coccineum]